jgi:hypothetical protein
MVARHCGFEQRNSGKIKAHTLISSFMKMMSEGGRSYWSWARCLTTEAGKTVSKQAVFGRMNEAWVKTIKTLLQEVIGQQADKQVNQQLFTHFKNVWLQDSTTIHLPDVLVEKFKGSFSCGKQHAIAKLNVVINAFSGLCPVMEWSSFTVNEQRLSASILQTAKAGDLVIRDLGYFVLNVFQQLTEANIYFLSRWKYGVQLNNIQSGEVMNLAKLLKGKAWLDQEVMCGKQNPVKVRLVAMKLSAEQTNERIRKAKRDRDRRVNHSMDYYTLLGYVIFITNVEAEKWNSKQVADAYRIRWNIETLFKSWKSGFRLEHIIPEARTNTARVESFLYLMLIYIAWFQLLIYAPLRGYVLRKTGKHLSIIKTAKLINSKSINWMKHEISNTLKKEITYHCCYDKRKDRVNEEISFYQLFTPLA